MIEGFEVLIVDDDASIRKRCVQLLNKKGYDVEGVSSGNAALPIVKNRQTPLVITDIRMAGINGIELLEKIRSESPETEVVMITGYGTVESAVKAIKLGAYDYLTKPFDMDKLLKVVENVATKFSLREENRQLRKKLDDYAEIGDIVSASSAMHDLFKLIDKVAPIDCNVLVEGESGTGKNLIAKQIHKKSPRAGKSFIIVDCASLSETLLESELFGYVKGAFTGAYTDKDGYFKVAHRGTILLDEVGELSPALQGKLLRIAQDHEIIPVGSTRSIPIDARILAATNKDLEALVREGKFREDLYFRLNVVKISVPPLRNRREDIPLLTHYFLDKFKKKYQKDKLVLNARIIASLNAYEWPGNVRELENLVQQLVIVADNGIIDPEAIPAVLKNVMAGNTADGPDKDDGILYDMNFQDARKICLDNFSRNYCIRSLRTNRGNVSATARDMNIRRSSLQRLMKRLGIRGSDIISDE